MKSLRHKINQSEDMARLDAERAKENLKKMKQEDLDQYTANKSKAKFDQRISDKDFINGRMAIDNSQLRSERLKKEVDSAYQNDQEIIRNALIDQILQKNQRATAASLKFPEVGGSQTESREAIRKGPER